MAHPNGPDPQGAWAWLWDQLSGLLGNTEAQALRKRYAEQMKWDNRRKRLAGAPAQIARLKARQAQHAEGSAAWRNFQRQIDYRQGLLQEAARRAEQEGHHDR